MSGKLIVSQKSIAKFQILPKDEMHCMSQYGQALKLQ